MTFIPSLSLHQPSTESGSLKGLAHWMRLALSGQDLAPCAQELIARAQAHPDDANALMDLSIILQLNHSRELALELQNEALSIKPLYHVWSDRPHRIRLLALCTPGDLMANTPLECLLENSDISLDLLYVASHLPLPKNIPEHDVAFMAIAESDPNRAILTRMQPIVQNWPRPFINRPLPILNLARETAYTLVRDEPLIEYPATFRIQKSSLEQVILQQQPLPGLINGPGFPIIIRPIASHAGHGLARISSLTELAHYLKNQTQQEFYVSRFIDYSSADGLFRKFRIVFIEDRPYLCHMAISEHWMIHYLNAGMENSEAKRLEEALHMNSFDHDFALRHQKAFSILTQRIGLDYFGMDCAETREGKLLIFE
ncbi:MAG: RimK family alpha-L-glutamate ligase, partial [Pseudomonadota bacterium]|nr:RimK family alpha-L-glutamate ligase [Pseudomonadota bacterium]